MAGAKEALTTSAAPGRVEQTFVVSVLLFAAGAFSSLWTVPGQTQNAAGMVVTQMLWVVIYLCTIFLLFYRCEQPFRTFFSEWPLVALCAFAMGSMFWSEAPGVTFRRSVALALTLLFGVYFASRFRLKEQLRVLAWTCAICIVFSFIFGALGLGNSVDEGGGVQGWYGIFDQKNGLGRMMVLSALVFVFWKRAEPEHKWLANAGLLGSIALVGFSRSMTAAVVLVLLLALRPYLRWTARKSLPWMIAGIGFLATIGLMSLLYVATHLEQVFPVIGKSVTLTGRLQLWILSVVMALRRPWLGYGYNAFWLPTQWFTVRIWRAMDWKAPHAHDGFIELWLELGIVGLGLFLLVFVYYVLRSVGFLRRYPNVDTAGWPLLFLIFQFLSNVTETDLLTRNNIFFILFVSSVLATRARAETVRNYEVSRVELESTA
jgi:exopolysaccharide production protein ExoQ